MSEMSLMGCWQGWLLLEALWGSVPCLCRLLEAAHISWFVSPRPRALFSLCLRRLLPFSAI